MSTTWVSWLSGEVPIIKRFSPLASQCSHGWQAHLVLTQTININPAINISQTLTICLALTTNSTLIINLTLTTLNLTMNLTKLTIILTLETQLKHSFQELNKECTHDILGSLIIRKYQKKKKIDIQEVSSTNHCCCSLHLPSIASRALLKFS